MPNGNQEQQELQFESKQTVPEDGTKVKQEVIEVEQETNTGDVPVKVSNMENHSPVSSSDASFANMAAFKDCFMIGKYFSQSSLVPKQYQGKPMDCAIAVDIANRMGISPMFVMQNLYVVQGTPSWSGQACMSIIRGCGRYKDVKPVYTGKRGEDSWGCYISAIEIKTGSEIKGVEVTIKMAKEEGWYGKSGSKWKTLPELMLCYRAAAFFARVYAPNELQGFKVEGEAEDISQPKQHPNREAVDMFGEGLV